MAKQTLYDQALIEQKRRQLKLLKSDFNPKKKFTDQIKTVLPNIKFKPKQEAYLNARQFIKWYLGGYKSGKTFTGISDDIWLSYVNRPYSGMLVHPTFDGLTVTIIPLIEEICELNKIDFDIKKLSTKYKVTFNFGLKKSECGNLLLASGDVPKSLKGPKLAFGHIDEPLIMKEEIVEIMMSRLAEVRGVLRQLQFTGTPEPSNMSWGWDIVDQEEEDSVRRFITTVSTRDVAEYLAPGYIEEMENNLTPEQIETFIDGKYRNLSKGKVYQNFSREKNMFDPETNLPDRNIPEKTIPEYAVGYDFNVNQMSGVLYELAGIQKSQLEEFRISSRSDTQELTAIIINRLIYSGFLIPYKTKGEDRYYTKYKRSLIITGDASGRAASSKSNKSDYEIIKAAFDKARIDITIYVPEANPSVRDRVNYVNQQYFNGTLWLSTKCILTKRDRELTSWKLGANGFFIDKSKTELSHLSDASDYVVYNTQTLTNDPEDSVRIKVFGRDRWS